MLNEIAKDIAATVRESVQAGIRALGEKFEVRFKAIEDRFAALPVPEKGDKGDSVTLEDVAPIIDATINKATANLKAPEVDYAALKEFISSEIAAIPRAKDGKSITVDNVRPVIDEAVQKAAQNIQVPEVDYDKVKDLITDLVAALPKAQDGKSITAEDVTPLLKELVDAIEISVPEKGEPGKSITLDDVKPLIDEAVNSAVVAIPKPKDGEPGKDANPIDMDAVQKMIDVAVAASLQAAVAKIHIPEPRDGEDGRDALALEILPEIDVEKSYNRNTYALYKGGLWRSFERTSGMRGWETVVDGIADIQIDYDGERGVKIVTEKSSGEIVTKEFIMPMVIDRGVYKDGQIYAKNDGITFGGSFWIAQKDAPAGKPGDGNQDYRLAVKRGRDANSPVKVK